MIVHVPALSAEMYSQRGSQFIVRASTMIKRDPRADVSPWRITLECPYTGKAALFAYDGSEIDLPSGQVFAWSYRPTVEAIREIPEMAGSTLTIYNN